MVKEADMEPAATSLRVLYLEDNPVDADLTRRELARNAPVIHLEVVATLEAALARLAPEQPPFEVILTDLLLPDGSGLELLTQVRERGLPLAVVIITGAGDQEAAVAALMAGADDYLVKSRDTVGTLPVVLHAAYASFQTRRRRRARPLRVLYGEPNEFDVDLSRRYLAKHAPHIRLESVDSGAELLSRLPRCPEDPSPYDLLLLDYRLTGLNALEVVKAVRQERRLDIPIVLVTGQGTEDVAVQALRLGVDDYLVKHEGYLQQLPAVLEKVQKQAELNASEAEFRRLNQEFNGLLDAIPDSLMLLDRDMKVLWSNRAGKEGTERNAQALEELGCPTLWTGCATSCGSCPVSRCFQSGLPVEETLTRPDGRIWDVRTVPLRDKLGKVNKVIAVRRDITEQKKLETQYLHAQKMESIGTLAGGVAHDFNNILTVIAGLGQITQMQMAEDDPLQRNIAGILEAAERAAHLTKELLLFSRKQQSTRSSVDLRQVVGKMEGFLQRIIGEDITLKQVSQETPLPVLADRNQLEQVLMNLAVNARDAMPQGGAFLLRTEQVELSAESVALHGGVRPGAYALLSASDDGAGMDQETLRRIFEPFFSTKAVGKGTGLGLSVVYGIVKQHDGFIAAFSEPGRGSTFRIYLPLSAEPVVGRIGARPEAAMVSGTETILLAEDNEQVRNLLYGVLTEAGYRVIVAVDGEQAVQKFKAHADSIELLLFDMIMPRMSGKEACDEIRRLKPGVKTLFASGYAPEMVGERDTLTDGSFLISKPVSPQELRQTVRRVLDGTMPEAETQV
jgi:two-component system, cell cycle sensor histidine kinase and response regulator CckA